MPKDIPPSQRMTIIRAYLVGLGNVSEICRMHMIARSTFYYYLRRYNNHGTILSPQEIRLRQSKKGKRRSRKFTNWARYVALYTLKRNPSTTLHELQAALAHHGVHMCISSIHRSIIHKLMWTFKRAAKVCIVHYICLLHRFYRKFHVYHILHMI